MAWYSLICILSHLFLYDAHLTSILFIFCHFVLCHTCTIVLDSAVNTFFPNLCTVSSSEYIYLSVYLSTDILLHSSTFVDNYIEAGSEKNVRFIPHVSNFKFYIPNLECHIPILKAIFQIPNTKFRSSYYIPNFKCFCTIFLQKSNHHLRFWRRCTFIVNHISFQPWWNQPNHRFHIPPYALICWVIFLFWNVYTIVETPKVILVKLYPSVHFHARWHDRFHTLFNYPNILSPMGNFEVFEFIENIEIQPILFWMISG